MALSVLSKGVAGRCPPGTADEMRAIIDGPAEGEVEKARIRLKRIIRELVREISLDTISGQFTVTLFDDKRLKGQTVRRQRGAALYLDDDRGNSVRVA